MVELSRRNFLKLAYYTSTPILMYLILRDKFNLPMLPSNNKANLFVKKITENYEIYKKEYPNFIEVVTAIDPTANPTKNDYVIPFIYDPYIANGKLKFIKQIPSRKVKISVLSYDSNIPLENIKYKINHYFNKFFGNELKITYTTDYESINVRIKKPDTQVYHPRLYDDVEYILNYKGDDEEVAIKFIKDILDKILPLCFEDNCIRNYKELQFLHSTNELILGDRCKNFINMLINAEGVSETKYYSEDFISKPYVEVKVKPELINNYKRVAIEHNLNIIRFLAQDMWDESMVVKFKERDKNNISYLFLDGINIVDVSFGSRLGNMKVYLV
jgi:hypothetical protein